MRVPHRGVAKSPKYPGWSPLRTANRSLMDAAVEGRRADQSGVRQVAEVECLRARSWEREEADTVHVTKNKVDSSPNHTLIGITGIIAIAH
jgi:hypothetical protein